jgi:hypothetical protein
MSTGIQAGKRNLHNFHSDTEYMLKIMSPSLMKHHTLKMYEGVEILLHAFLTSTLDVNGWPASRSGCLMPVEQALIPTG